MPFYQGVALFLLLAPAAFSQSVQGYLSNAQMQAVIGVMPPPPAANDVRDNADLAVFRGTRSLQGTPRWTLAQADDDLSIAALLRDFQCSAGLVLDAASTPKTWALMMRVN